MSPGIHTTARRERQRAPRIALGHEAAARREAGSRSRVSAAQRIDHQHRDLDLAGTYAAMPDLDAPISTAQRIDLDVPKGRDVRTPSRRQAARICHSTERSRAWHRHQWRHKQGTPPCAG